MVIVGIDPSKKWLQCYIKSGTKEKSLKIKNDISGWRKLLRISPDAVYIEGASVSYVKQFVTFLSENGIKVKNVPPYHNSRIRDVLSESKDDVKDAEACGFIGKYLPEKTGTVRSDFLLMYYIRFRNYLINRKIEVTERLQSLLDILWVDHKKYFRKIDTKWALNFLKLYPSPDDLKNINWGKIFTNTTSSRARKAIKNRFQSVPTMYLDRELAEYLKSEIKFLVEDIEKITKQIELLDSKISKHIHTHQQYKNLLTFPGIKETSAGVILAYINSREFKGINHFLSYAGLVPLKVQTGSQPIYFKKRNRYNRELQKILFMLALRLSRTHPVSKKYYDKKLREKKRKMTAIWALARQLAKIIFIMITHNETYSYHVDT